MLTLGTLNGPDLRLDFICSLVEGEGEKGEKGDGERCVRDEVVRGGGKKREGTGQERSRSGG